MRQKLSKKQLKKLKEKLPKKQQPTDLPELTKKDPKEYKKKKELLHTLQMKSGLTICQKES